MKTFTFIGCFCAAVFVMQAQDTLNVPAEYATIQSGIVAAEPGDIVLVSDGIYYEQINFQGKAITVASEFLLDGNEFHILGTKIDGSQIGNVDNGSIVSFISGEDTNSVLCGFTIQNGNKGSAYTLPGGESVRAGGAITISGSGAKIIHNRIINNHMNHSNIPGNPMILQGAGIYSSWEQYDNWIVIDQNVFDNNSVESDLLHAGGAAAFITYNAIITNNYFSNNASISTSTAHSYAGGLVCAIDPTWNWQVSALIQGNTFLDNYSSSQTSWTRGTAVLTDRYEIIFSDNVLEGNTMNSVSSNGAGLFISNPRGNSSISNNTFKENVSDGDGGGLYITYEVSGFPNTSRLPVQNNMFINNEAVSGGGMMIYDKPVILQNNVLNGNMATVGGAIRLVKAAMPLNHLAIMMNNSFSQNQASSLGGAIAADNSMPLIINSIFWQDSGSSSEVSEIYLSSFTDSVEIANCNIDFSLINRNIIDGGGNINEDPLFTDLDYLTIDSVSSCYNAGTEEFTCECGVNHICPIFDIDGTPRPQVEMFDMGAYEWYPALEVPADYPTIQAAIVAAKPGDIVLVDTGTYYEQINFLGKAITVTSKYLYTGDTADIDNTIIDGSNLTSGDSCSVVYFINDEDTTSVLCGFTIQHGKGTYHTYSNETFNAGGAIFIHTAGAKIIHNHITENHLNDTFPGNPQFVDAAGIAIYGNTDKWVVIDHNQIDYNSCYASEADAARTVGMWVYDHNCLITNNNISNDTCIGEGNSSALAGAFVCYSPLVNVYSAIIQSNVFRYNLVQSSDYAAAACGATQNYIIKFSGNLVENNKSDGNSLEYWDGGIFEIVDPGPGSFVKNNTFHGNTTYRLGGALNLMLLTEQADHETLIVENNYFLENESSNGGALHSRNVPVLLQNNVFSGNHSTGHGGAILFQKNMESDNPHLLTSINNSFFGNTSDFSGGAIYTTQVDPLIINSIFWKDSSNLGSNEIYVGTFNSVEIANTDIDLNGILGELIDGGGNINSDPLFISPDLLIPSGGSPCIDVGTDVFTCECGVTNYCPDYDIMDTIRPLGEIFDMGAYEWYLGVGIPSDESPRMEANIYPNPFNSQTTINYTLEKSTRVKITILNGFGQMVALPVNDWQQEGEHKLVFNAESLPSGIYFYRIEAGSLSGSGKMVVVR